MWGAPRARIERLIRVEGLEHLRALGGAPAILFVPHFVGLDAGGTRLSCEIDAVSMYASQKDAKFNELLLRGRSRFRSQRLVSRQEGIRATIAAMRDGRPFYYLPDQDYRSRDAIFVPFFGVPAATVPGLSRIARLAGRQSPSLRTRMLPDGAGYVLRIEPPWDKFPDRGRGGRYAPHERIHRAPRAGNAGTVSLMHKRFKTRPEGEARFY